MRPPPKDVLRATAVPAGATVQSTDVTTVLRESISARRASLPRIDDAEPARAIANVTTALEAALRAEAPPQSVPGGLLVKVIAADKGGDKLALPNLTIELRAADVVIARATTDATGIATLPPLPEGDKRELKVIARATDQTVVATAVV